MTDIGKDLYPHAFTFPEESFRAAEISLEEFLGEIAQHVTTPPEELARTVAKLGGGLQALCEVHGLADKPAEMILVLGYLYLTALGLTRVVDISPDGELAGQPHAREDRRTGGETARGTIGHALIINTGGRGNA